MRFWRRLTKSNFFIRLTSWEYWPFGILQFPVFFYYFYLSLRARSFLFFSASNPGITMGGMFGESKYEIIKKIPGEYTPRTILIKIPSTTEEVIKALSTHQFNYPVIFKPDIGERGYMVKKIKSDSDIPPYLEKIKTDFIVQEFVDMPLEFGVFYTRLPEEPSGRVTSIVTKEMLAVDGDGKSSLQELILRKDRAKLQWHKLKVTYEAQLDQVLAAGTKFELVGIGNHALGTTFRDGTRLINTQLSNSFDNISKQIDGFYFGRFDLRCQTVADLQCGKVKIMELNGCGAEPAHIYEPGFSLFKAVWVMLIHWQNIYRISIQNRKRGVNFISFDEARQLYRKFKAATRS
jgi:hypothetical protein